MNDPSLLDFLTDRQKAYGSKCDGNYIDRAEKVMKTTHMIACLVLLAVTVFAGCRQGDVVTLNDRIAGLLTENQAIKAKLAKLIYDKANLEGQINDALNSVEVNKKSFGLCKRELEQAHKNVKSGKGAKVSAKKDTNLKTDEKTKGKKAE